MKIFSGISDPIVRGTIRTAFVLGLRLLVQAGTLLLMARILGPSGFGAFAGVTALAVVLGTLTSFGTHQVLLGEVSKESLRREQVLSYALPVTVLCGALLFCAFMLVCLIWLRSADLTVGVLVAIGLTDIVILPLLVFCVMEHHGLGRIARSQLLNTLPLVLRIIVAASVMMLTPANPLAVYVYGCAAVAVLALSLGITTLPAPWPAKERWRLPKAVELRHSTGFAALNITRLAPTELDKTVAARLLPLDSAGIYAASARLIGAITLPVTAMLLAALPRLFRETQTGVYSKKLVGMMFGAAVIYGVILAAIVWYAAPILPWIFGESYEGIVSIVRSLCFAIPGMALRFVGGNVLMAFGRPWERVFVELLGLLALLLISVVMVPRVGALGMPLAMISSEWTMALLASAMVVRGFHCKLKVA